MITPAEIVSQMQEREARDPEAMWWPDKSEVLRWVENDLERMGSLFDALAAFIARGYAKRDLSFELCDGIVNGIYAAVLELPLTPVPPLFYDVFLAFDAGEYPHRGDDASVNPIAKYTDPRIREIVECLTA
jgi:hypothetical protein